MPEVPQYSILLSEESLNQIKNYKKDLISKKLSPGAHFDRVLKVYTNWSNNKLEMLTTEKFIELLLGSKKPKCFATHHIKCDGTDWTLLEFSILGNINIAVPVEIYDNGAWSATDKNFKKHNVPFVGELLYTPGPLLRKGRIKGNTPDYDEVVSHGNVNQEQYNKLINRRLSPLFSYAGETAKKEGKKAVIIVPGLGCGVFAGKFKGKLGTHLNLAIQNVIERNGRNYKNISCIIFDPYNECDNERKMIQGIQYRVRPFEKQNGKSQLEKLDVYAEPGDDFSNCKLFKMVAWDHVSWPGNNFFEMKRQTDDGVAAAATSSMKALTNVKGEYENGIYFPPSEYESWKEVVEKNEIILKAFKNVFVFTQDGKFLSLDEVEGSVK